MSFNLRILYLRERGSLCCILNKPNHAVLEHLEDDIFLIRLMYPKYWVEFYTKDVLVILLNRF